MILQGYRQSHAGLLSGWWLPGELVGLPLPDTPALAERAVVHPPADRTTELCIVPDVAFVRFTEIDWVARRARLEIGVQPASGDRASVSLLVETAVSHGFRVLNLHRVYGWVTPATDAPVDSLHEAGFRREATVPCGNWYRGEPVEREIWGVIRDG